MTPSTQDDFAAELEKLRATNNSGPLDRRISAFGVLLAVAGVIVIVVGYVQSRGFADIRDQMDSLILSLLGLGLMGFGSILYLRGAMTRFLRYWLLRMVYEQRSIARGAEPAVSATPQPLTTEAAATPTAAPAATPTAAPAATPTAAPAAAPTAAPAATRHPVAHRG
jgi:hypothetical protein